MTGALLVIAVAELCWFVSIIARYGDPDDMDSLLQRIPLEELIRARGHALMSVMAYQMAQIASILR